MSRDNNVVSFPGLAEKAAEVSILDASTCASMAARIELFGDVIASGLHGNVRAMLCVVLMEDRTAVFLPATGFATEMEARGMCDALKDEVVAEFFDPEEIFCDA